MTFESLGLAPALLRALVEQNYLVPTPIQMQAIPLAMDGHDVLGGAQTGTGKTAAFGLPLLNRLAKLTAVNGPREARRHRGPGDGESRPHARHGLPAGDQAHPRPRPARAPDAAVLGDVRG